MPRITERDMEAAIEMDLTASGYFSRDPSCYDKSLCLDSDMFFRFIQATQMKKWEDYQKQLGDKAKDALLAKISSYIEESGTLNLLRKPFGTYGVYFDFAYFKPASGLNESYITKYQNNMFSVMRQVRYSRKNNNSLDMVLFLNGLPLATIEIKDRLTGSGYNVENAIRQYQTDRDPNEPLFRYKRCLVHFALDEEQVYMTTRLTGPGTRFLPFNKGYNGQAGNPPVNGFSTEYLWKEILQRDSFLDLLQRFIHETDIKDENGKPTGEKKLIFPRYHQLDSVRKITAHAKENGTGRQYLVQHSAGSGKSNTISWLAHHLSTLHDANDINVFDSIIVVSDRRILDKQLRESVRAFELTSGVVAPIENGSRQLREQLEAGTKIIVSTLQKFPYIEDTIQALPGKRFAIILDEAHSSSSGEMSKSMKKVLNMNAENDPEEEDKTWEDEIADQMQSRGRQKNISYFAFTATPKPKTLELFGTLQEDGSYRPFHIYSMRQAIQEGFIKDVLPNYINYKTYFRLFKIIKDDPTYEKGKATRLLKTFVEMSDHTVDKKTEIIINHFLENCLEEIGGRAKAMVVCSSRAQAVKYKLAFDWYIINNKLPFLALVAFSGSIVDNADKAEYTEAGLNGFPEDKTAERFQDNRYRFLIAANKFQTGFDQPLLYAMYLNKKVQGVNAVQTMSRLNRIYPGKKDPITLDFANDSIVIAKSFQDFYEDVSLEEGSDPDKLYDFKRSLEEFHYFHKDDVDAFAKTFFSKGFKQESLLRILNPVIIRFSQEENKERQENFRLILKAYVRVYAFLAQIISFSDLELEKLYMFGKILLRKLPYEKEKLPKEVTQQVDLDSIRIELKGQGIKLKPGEGEPFKPGDDKPLGGRQEFYEPLSAIIKSLNERHGINLNDDETLKTGAILSRLASDPEMIEEIKNNPKENVYAEFKNKFNREVQKLVDDNFEYYKKINNNPAMKEEMMRYMFAMIYENTAGKNFRRL